MTRKLSGGVLPATLDGMDATLRGRLRRHKRTERPPSGRSSRRRRLLWLVGLLLAGVGVLTVARIPTAFCLARAEASLDQSNLSAAVLWTERAERLGGREARTAFVRGRLERKLGRLDLAGGSLRRAQELGYDAAAVEREFLLTAAQGGALENPTRELARLLATGEGMREVAEAFVRGDILTYRLDDAMGLLEVWKRDLPNDPDAHYLTGRILEHRSNLPGAEREFRASLAAAPYHAGAAYNLGRILSSGRKPEEALAQYKACVEHLYEPQPAEVGVARCLRELGRYDEARAALERASAASPERLEIACCIIGDPIASAGAQLEEEWGRLEMAEENWAEAERRLRAAFEASPRNWRLHYALATVLRQQGRNAEAAEEIKRHEQVRAALESCDRLYDVLREDPGNADARFHIGRVLFDHVSEEQGIIWLRSVLDYDPDHVGAHRALADAYAGMAHKSSQYARLAEQHRRSAEEAQGRNDSNR